MKATHLLAACLISGILFTVNAWAQGGSQVEPRYMSDVQQLAKHPSVIKAFDLIKAEDPRTVKEHILLTEIEAPPFGEAKRAQQFSQMLKEAGLDSVWIDQEGNVLGLRKGTKREKVVVLDAHLDTVFPEGTDVTVRSSGDTLFAPGIGDDTRGLAMVLSVVRALNQNKIRTDADILFVGSVGEEGLGDLRGVKYLFSDQGPKIDSWISIDGGDLGRVNNAGLGSYRYKVTFNGPGGHSWGAFGLANPLHALASGIHYFVQEADALAKPGLRTSYNVGRIGGGTSVNSIPFEAWIEVDMRSEYPEMLDKMAAILDNTMRRGLKEQNDLRRRGDSLTVSIELIGKRPSGSLATTLPLIQRAMAAVTVFGETPSLTRGSTNANIPIAMGIPAVTIGRGGEGGNAHALDEWWSNKEGYRATQYALLLLLAESGLSK